MAVVGKLAQKCGTDSYTKNGETIHKTKQKHRIHKIENKHKKRKQAQKNIKKHKSIN